MAETIVSPGVISIENDQSFITQQPIQAGAAIIGPTVKGPVGIPTICTTYSQYLNKFGAAFISGSQTYTFLTSIAAYNYFQGAGSNGSLLVTRVVSGSTSTDWTPATSNISNAIINGTGSFASASMEISSSYTASFLGSPNLGTLKINVPSIGSTYTDYWIQAVSNAPDVYFGNMNIGYVSMSLQPTLNEFGTLLTNYINSPTVQQLIPTQTPTEINQLFSASFNTSTKVFTLYSKISSSLSNGIIIRMGSSDTPIAAWYPDSSFVSSSIMVGGSDGIYSNAFTLETISEGIIMNSSGPTGSNGTLLSGSLDNVRIETANVDTTNGTFTLLVRQGNDTSIQKSILETFSNLSLDPNSNNYIEKRIGNQYKTIIQDPTTLEYYIQLQGNYPTLSNYIRVKEVITPTINYLNNNGTLSNPLFLNYLPLNQSSSFADGKGSIIPTGMAGNYYEKITDNNIQGLNPTNYTPSISLLANKEAFKYNLITAPGLIADPNSSPLSTAVINQLIDVVTTRGDSMAIIDIAKYGENLLPVINNVTSQDTSFAATYWPWLKTIDPDYITNVWVPASTMMPRVYAQSDNMSHPWFAPAGINRGRLTTVTQAEKTLTQGNRDLLYQNNINPIASFSTSGGNMIVAFGQKTLYKKNTSLNRVNVRRLLIELKNYISQVADNFVFEQNTSKTQESFLSLINPYLSIVQAQEGLQSFQVIMDSTNNTPTTIDNNQLIGQIYLQPTKTVEFIILDFNILPTGATFS